MPTPVCYGLPPSGNPSAKVLVLYLGGDDSGSSYPAGLGAARVLPQASAGCVNISVARGLPCGRYTVALEDPAGGGNFAATASFDADRAAVTCAGLTKSAAFISPVITWSMPAARATVRDTVRVMNARGDVVYWFYTSCKCNKVPGAVPSPSGAFTLKLAKGLPGGFTFQLYPGGGLIPAAIAPDWIPWAKMGW
jgi:hypothetical protein